MIVAARVAAQMDQAMATGWQAERFARTKRMKPLGEYMTNKSRDAGRSGAAKVLDLFRRKAAETKGRSNTG